MLLSILFLAFIPALAAVHEHLLKNETFDYIVVGGGTAGLTIASRLAQRNFHVAVVEAGGYYEIMHPISQIPGAACLGAGADIRTTSAIDWGFVAQGGPGANHRDIHYPRGKCLGGSCESNFVGYRTTGD